MAAKTFGDWDCINNCEVEDRQCGRCEEAWKAATEAVLSNIPTVEKCIKAYTENHRSFDALEGREQVIRECYEYMVKRMREN